MNAALAFFLWFTAAFLPQVSITGNVKIAGPVTINAGGISSTVVTLCAPGTNSPCTVAQNAPINSGIIAGIGAEYGVATTCGTTIFTLSDSGVNAYACDQIAASNAINVLAQVNHAPVTSALASGTGTIAVSPNSNLNWTILDVTPYVGVDTGIGGIGSPMGTSISVALGTTTGSSDLCVGQIVASNSTSLTITAGAGWTPAGSTYNNGDNRYMLTEYEIVTSGTSVTLTGTFSGTPSGGAEVAGQCYKL